MPMTCCRKPGFAFTRCGTPIARANRRFHGSSRLPGTFVLTTIGNLSGPQSASGNWRQCRIEACAVPGESDHADGLNALLAPLSESQREVIEMLKVAGMSLEEVARATSSSVGSVKQKVHRAYKKLRETMSATGFRKGQSGGLS